MTEGHAGYSAKRFGKGAHEAIVQTRSEPLKNYAVQPLDGF